MSYKDTRNYLNTQKGQFYQEGWFDIPILKGCGYLMELDDFMPFNSAKVVKSGRERKGIHFFIDDYQFERVWTFPDKQIELLKQYAVVCSPDFSLFTDYSRSLQIYNHYRKHWLGAYWESKGITVIPTICWADPGSYDFCFDGEPQHSIVAISTQGCLKSRKEIFLKGYSEMLERLKPSGILFYGDIPEEINDSIPKIQIESYAKKVLRSK